MGTTLGRRRLRKRRRRRRVSNSKVHTVLASSLSAAHTDTRSVRTTSERAAPGGGRGAVISSGPVGTGEPTRP